MKLLNGLYQVVFLQIGGMDLLGQQKLKACMLYFQQPLLPPHLSPNLPDQSCHLARCHYSSMPGTIQHLSPLLDG